MELIDNTFLRQYELEINNELAKIEYSLQDRKIFLTKMIIPSSLKDNNFTESFLVLVLDNIKEREISVVPTAPTIAKFMRKNRKYKRLLPVGIRI
jgi:predicted GNAT family acetyltransferase